MTQTEYPSGIDNQYELRLYEKEEDKPITKWKGEYKAVHGSFPRIGSKIHGSSFKKDKQIEYIVRNIFSPSDCKTSEDIRNRIKKELYVVEAYEI